MLNFFEHLRLGKRTADTTSAMTMARQGESPLDSYDDSGRCPLSRAHKFIPVLDEDHKVGIFCIYCDYVLYEHASNVYVTPKGELIGNLHPGGSRFIRLPLHE